MSISFALEIETGPDKKSMETLSLVLATTYITAFEDRLDRGIGVNGQQMPPYVDTYKKQRSKRGRQTRVRDLRFSNQMRKAFQLIDQQFSESGFVNKFGWITKDARNKAEYNHRRSPFAGFSDSDILAIQSALDDWISRQNNS